MKRIDHDSFREKLPGCDGDPSYEMLTTKYKVEGYEILKPGDDDVRSTRHTNNHCSSGSWRRRSNTTTGRSRARRSAAGRPAGALCRTIDIGQWCTTIVSSHSSGYGGRLFEAAFEFAVPRTESGRLTFGTAHSYKMDWDWSKSNSVATCTSTSTGNRVVLISKKMLILREGYVPLGRSNVEQGFCTIMIVMKFISVNLHPACLLQDRPTRPETRSAVVNRVTSWKR
ncbi:hypothetical protein GGR53DRAFT_526347 [Hypoxylon sp. FL1150]|nr:hypothetical protein GGR53DRAFT_526347 [Hypoxylon sp. FL1150]